MAPRVLYRYRSLAGESFKYTQDIFLRKRLYLGLATAMNDPGEGACTFALAPLPATATEAEKWGHGNYGWGMQIRHRQSMSSIHLASFSATRTNPLLWAHYADSHRGICIGFLTASSPCLESATEVKYGPVPPAWGGRDEDLADIYCAKSSDWAYEQEWRIIRRSADYVTLPEDAITEVILGARISSEDAQWVRDWVNFHNDSLQLERASFEPGRYEMRIVRDQVQP